MTSAGRAPGRLAALAGAVVLGLGLGACGGTPTPSPRPTASPGLSVGPSATAGVVVVDPGLLEILPADVGGIPVQAEPDLAEQLAADPSVAADVEALALAMAVDRGGEGEDFAIINVVRPRSGRLDEAFFRSWRDTYDEGACGPAGGVAGNAEAEIGGRRVYIGTCGGGARTYHVVHESGVIVSITAAGERRLGEAVVEALAP